MSAFKDNFFGTELADVREVPTMPAKSTLFVPARNLDVSLRSAHDASLQLSGLSIEACSMAFWTEQIRTSGLLQVR